MVIVKDPLFCSLILSWSIMPLMSQWKMGEHGSRVERRLAALGLTVPHTPPLKHDHRCVTGTLGERASSTLQRTMTGTSVSSETHVCFAFYLPTPPKAEQKLFQKFIYLFICIFPHWQFTSSRHSFWKGSVNSRCWMFSLLVHADFRFCAIIVLHLFSLFSLLWNVVWMEGCRLAFSLFL